MDLVDEKGNPISLDSIEDKFERIKDAPQQDLPSPPKKERTPKPERTAAKPRTTSKPREKSAPVTVTPALTEARTKKVSEILTITSGTLLLAGNANNSVPLRADGHVISALTPQLSESVATVAAHDPAVARLLDNEGSARAASYVGLAAVVFSLGSQLAANHGFIKPGVMSTASAEQIVAAFEPEGSADGGAHQ